VRCLEIVAANDRVVPGLLRKSEQDLVQGIKDVDTRRTRAYGARQGILTRDNRRIFRAQPIRPCRLELDADKPAEKRPAFLSMTKVRFVHDYFVPMSGSVGGYLGRALGGFWKTEGEFPERRCKRQAARSQEPAIFQDVDRIYKVAVVSSGANSA
jgi:hypothetical protein